MTTTTSTNFVPLLERFFTQRLMQQRQVLTFTQQRLHTPPPEAALNNNRFWGVQLIARRAPGVSVANCSK